MDRVGFPEGYIENFKQFFVFDRQDARSVQYVCANDIAASVKSGEPFPYGSILVFETWRPRQDSSGNLIKDSNGHLIRGTLNTIFVMRKEKGFGEAYESLRNGEWEYVAYRPDKSYQTRPEATQSCAACHQAAAGKDRDWVFRAELFFTKERYAQSPLPGPNEVSLSRVAFFPNNLSIKGGTTLKWTNSAVDLTDHTVTANDNSFESGTMKPGASFTYTFNKAGTYQYFCALHPEQMRATIRVTE